MENSDIEKEQRKEESGGEEQQGAVVLLNELPEGCIAKIVSLTTPADACRVSCVSATFRSAAASDCVWASFLPSDYQTIFSTSSSEPRFSSLSFPSKKDLFFYLSRNPIVIDDDKKSFSLDIWSGKKIYMIAPRDLVIVWGDTPHYWEWISHPESRFKEVALLNHVWWLEIRGKISTSKLSRDTNYAAYLVFQMESTAFGFEHYPAEVSVVLGADKLCSKSVILYPIIETRRLRLGRRGRIMHWYAPQAIDPDVIAGLQRPEKRADGWLEIEIGDFFNRDGEDEVEMDVKEVKAGAARGGLILQGIEIRPKEKKAADKMENAELLS